VSWSRRAQPALPCPVEPGEGDPERRRARPGSGSPVISRHEPSRRDSSAASREHHSSLRVHAAS
jgi:hypothetical protein